MRPRPDASFRRVATGLVAGALLFTACGSTSGDGDAGTGAAATTTTGGATPGTTDPGTSAPVAGEPAAAEPESGTSIDLIGAEVRPESDVAGNLLPDVVVDDLNTGRKVNFRNLVPRDKPILLWMWAPH